MILVVAVKDTGVQGHIAPEGIAAIVTEGVILGFTAIVMVLEDAVLAVKQVPPLTIISQETVLLLARVEEV